MVKPRQNSEAASAPQFRQGRIGVERIECYKEGQSLYLRRNVAYRTRTLFNSLTYSLLLKVIQCNVHPTPPTNSPADRQGQVRHLLLQAPSPRRPPIRNETISTRKTLKAWRSLALHANLKSVEHKGVSSHISQTQHCVAPSMTQYYEISCQTTAIIQINNSLPC